MRAGLAAAGNRPCCQLRQVQAFPKKKNQRKKRQNLAKFKQENIEADFVRENRERTRIHIIMFHWQGNHAVMNDERTKICRCHPPFA